MTGFLVVDEDAGTRRVLQEVLVAKGFQVQLARDGPMGLRLLAGMEGARFILLNPTAPGVELTAYTRLLRRGDRLLSLPSLIVATTPREAGGSARLHKRPVFLEHIMDAIGAQGT